jgi:ERCC4-type nuclease
MDDREDPLVSDMLIRWGLPVSVVRLDFGDCVMQSRDGLSIAYERKRLSDMINSMLDRRLAGFQLSNMRRIYDRTEIVFEGLWRPGVGDGSIQIPQRVSGGKVQWVPYYYNRRGVSYRQLDGFIYTQYECAGVPCWRTQNAEETAMLYASRYEWWQKDYELHRSHDLIYTNNPSAQRRGSVTIHQGQPNPVVMVAAQVPGIDSKAWDVGRQFASVNEMVNASESDWCGIEWIDRKGNVKHFGKESAKGIVLWFKGAKQ